MVNKLRLRINWQEWEYLSQEAKEYVQTLEEAGLDFDLAFILVQNWLTEESFYELR